MKPKSKIAKGKILEKWLADRFRHTGIDPMAQRQIGSGSGKRKGDIHTSLPITFECKNTAKFQTKFIEQAEKESFGYQDYCVVWHKNGTPLEGSFVFMPYSLFEKLLKVFVRKGE